MKVLAAIATIALLFVVAGGKFELRWWTTSGASNIPAAKDANRLLEAAAGAHLDASAENLQAMTNGININTPAGEAVLRHQVPGVASRMAEQAEEARRRVTGTQVDTVTGRRLRTLFARALLAERIMYDDLARGLLSKRAVRPAVRLWVRRYNRWQGWIAAGLKHVVAQAPLEDQAPVSAALNGF